MRYPKFTFTNNNTTITADINSASVFWLESGSSISAFAMLHQNVKLCSPAFYKGHFPAIESSSTNTDRSIGPEATDELPKIMQRQSDNPEKALAILLWYANHSHCFRGLAQSRNRSALIG
jgi:hypothetical protein